MKNISDDIIVFGMSKEDHGTVLDVTFRILCENGLASKHQKCEYNKNKVVFFVVTFRKDGVPSDLEKIYKQ